MRMRRYLFLLFIFIASTAPAWARLTPYTLTLYAMRTQVAYFIGPGLSGGLDAWVRYAQNTDGQFPPADTLGWHRCPNATLGVGTHNGIQFWNPHQRVLVRVVQHGNGGCYKVYAHPDPNAAPTARGWVFVDSACNTTGSHPENLEQATEWAQAVMQPGPPVPQFPNYGNEGNVIVDKPVLYLYPSVATRIRVQLDLPEGTVPVCYPPLRNGQWHITAQPDGTLRTDSAGPTYPNLFWEAPLNLPFPPTQYAQGWVVRREELVPFLEARLAEMNFNDRERAEFIQYWLPRMGAHPQVFVHFGWVGQHAATGPFASPMGEAYDAEAPLGITPAPDEYLRVLMYWQPAARTSRAATTPQQLPRLARTGYHALEWGGTQIGGVAL